MGCSGPQCSRPIAHLGLCNAHYRQQWEKRPLTVILVCDICGKDLRTDNVYGVCKAHSVEHGERVRRAQGAQPMRRVRPTDTCSAPRCERTAAKFKLVGGLCPGHLGQKKRGRPFTDLGQLKDCGEPGCTGIHNNRLGNAAMCPRSLRQHKEMQQAWRANPANRARANRRDVERRAARTGKTPLADRTWQQTHAWRDELYELQNGLCAWVRCGKPLGDLDADGRTQMTVDHRHECINPHNSDAYACPECLRGLVHYGCNAPLIARWEWLIREGYEIQSKDSDVIGYLNSKIEGLQC